MDSILQMKPGNLRENLFRPVAKQAVVPPLEIAKAASPVKAPLKQAKMTEQISQDLVVRQAPENNDKVNNFMKFMDDIEEEMSSQYS